MWARGSEAGIRTADRPGRHTVCSPTRGALPRGGSKTTPMMRAAGKILVADDDQEIRLGVSELLLPLGLEVVEASTGPEALEIARARLVDAMVLDCHMPGCSGLDVLISLSSEISIPCIFCTGRPSKDLETAVRNVGVWAFLQKPIRPDVLRSEVLRALEHVRGTREGSERSDPDHRAERN